MAEHLADRHVLSRVVPLVIDCALQQRAKDELVGPGAGNIAQQVLGGQPLQPGIGGSGNRALGGPRLLKQRGAGRRAIGKQLVEVRHEDLILCAP